MSDLIITGVIDGPLSGGVPKAVELYALKDIPDLSIYGLGSANNGGGSDGEEYTFSGSATAGQFIYIASESTGFESFFGFAPDDTSGAASINGDDAIELFQNGTVVDVFGDINTDGSGQPWEYLDGWAYRTAGGPDGSTFVSSNWSFSGPNALDGETGNSSAANQFPIGSFGATSSADFTITQTGNTQVDEIGTTDTFDVVLTTQPTSDVVINVSSGDTGEATVSPASITFTNSNWDTPQTVTVTGVDDSDTDGSQSTTVTLSVDAANSDDAFDSIADKTVSVTTIDDDVTITPIYDIQGAAHTSPLNGELVTTTGIVTAVDTNGFYLQDATGDNNNATSDALFVFTGSAPTVAVGDDVEVSGTVSEFTPGGTSTGNLSTTQISGSPTVTVNSSGNALPEATIIGAGGRVPPSENIDDDAFGTIANTGDFEPDTDGIDFFESLEAMRVTAQDAVAVAPTNRFGEIFTVVDNGADATGISDRGTLNISPDDFNPEKVQIDEDSGVFNFDFPDVNVGAKLGDVTGVVGYSFGNFEIIPTEDFTGNIVESTIAAETTTIEGSADKLTVASYNVLNLEPNDADGDTDVANGRFDAIAAQIVNNLKTPDIIGLQEIQDNSGSADDGTFSANDTLQLLVDAISTAGGPTYSFIDNTFIGDDTSGGQPVGNIRTAFLYNPERVGLDPTSVESIQDSDQQTNPDNPFFDARLPIVATFTFNGQEVTVVNNHFSSKGGSSPILGVEQPFEARQEEVAVNGSLDERQAQSGAVKEYVDGILAEDPDANVVVMGDLNEFEFVSPVTNLTGNLTNLTDSVAEDERYSFIFQGNSQSLDHILVSGNLADNAEFDIVHVNSEFAETDTRASDHDPLVASLSLTENTENMEEINLSQIGRFTSADGAEIVAHDPETQRLFVTTGDTVEIIDISDPANPAKVDSATIDVSSIDGVTYGGANSVAVMNGIVAIAVEGNTETDSGVVAFYDADGNSLGTPVTVGILPDMLTFTPDGMKVLTANEGQPNDEYTEDPEGSISIIDISGGVDSATVMTADFTGFNDQKQALMDAGVRIFGEKTNADGTKTASTVAEDLEPEYIAVSPDGSQAFVTLQENNAVAVLDIATASVTDILPLGEKDHSLEDNKLDASNRDGGINIENWPVFGLYQPDAIASFEANGQNYYITANEGDARDYDGFSEEVRVKDLTLDPTAYPNAATLQQDENLGRLKTTTASGDTDGDGDVDQIYSYGGRSFTIWDEQGNLVFDSGDEIANILAAQTPELFNANDGVAAEFDERSDDKGAEPESVTVGVINGKPYGFVGLERAGGGVLVYDLSNPTEPDFIQYIRTEGDIAPEGLKFISGNDSPNGQPMLAVANEVSLTTTLYEIEVPNYTLQILHASDLEGGVDAIDSAANFAAIVDRFEDDYDNTVVLSAGDNYIPGPFFGAAGDRSLRTPLQEFYQDYFNEDGLTNIREGVGRVDISIMNAIGFDASAVGNHEFDAGTNAIGDIIGTDIRGAELSDVRWLGAQFPYLSANLDFSGDGNLSGLYTSDILANTEFQSTPDDLTAAAAAPKIAPATIIEEGGEKIGVVGATTQIVETISSTGGVDVIDPESNDMAALAAILQPTINQLIDDGINKVVVVSHLQQIALEKELAGLLSGVDVIIAGGSDTLQADSTDRLRNGDTPDEGYPFETTNADGDPAVIVSTAGEYSYVGRLVVEFDADGKVILDSIDENVSGAYATDEQGVTDVYGANVANAFAEGSKGAEVQDLTDAVETVVTENDGITFGKSDVFLEGRRSEVRTQETNLGNLTADANLAAAKKADESVVISIKNGGGIRAEIGSIDGTTGELGTTIANPDAGKEAGEISQLDLENSLRFNNGLTLLTVTAQELLAIIEHGVAESGDGATPGRFPQVSGLSFSFDDDSPAGDRVESLAVVDEEGNIIDVVAKDSELQGDASRTFRIVTLNFLAGGGDGFPFPTGESANRVDLEVEERTGEATAADDGTEQDALAEFLAENFSETPFNVEDVSEEFDTRIQNLDFRQDTVLIEEEVPGTDSDDTLAGGDTNDFIDAGAGNDVIEPGEGDDIIDAGPGNDTIVGGQGDNQINGGEGIDTVEYAGNSDDFDIERIGEQVKVGSNTDTLTNVEFLEFNDTTIDTSDIIEDAEKSLVSGTPGDDTLIAGVDGFNAVFDTVFTGAGDDEVDLAFVNGNDNRVNAGSGNDTIFVSHRDRVFGSAGNDEFDATDGTGKNRMSGGSGDDIFYLGMNDRALGGEGDDKFFVQFGGDNILSGGEGADEFWIVSTEIPEAANTIVDFEIGTDVIGISGSAGLGIDASTLELNVVGGNTEIGFAGDTLAILNGVTGLDVNDTNQFVFG